MGVYNNAVIIPAKNEKECIASTIASIIQAGIDPSAIFVIDDGSDDGTGDIARAMGVVVLRNDINLGKAASVKKIVEVFSLDTSYEFISLMDADTVVDERYFAAVKESFEDESVNVVCGQPKSRPHNWLTAYRCFCYYISAKVYRPAQTKMGVINVAPGCSTTYRAVIFNQLEWSKDTIVEDMDVTIQVHHKKIGKIAYQAKAIVHTQDPRTVRDYIKQMVRWNSGAWQVVKKHQMITGVKRVDWESKMLMGEGLILSLWYPILPVIAYFYPSFALFAMMGDFGSVIILSAVAAYQEKRGDVLVWSWTYPLIRFVDSTLYWYCFWNIMIRRRHVSSWNSVKRYA